MQKNGFLMTQPIHNFCYVPFWFKNWILVPIKPVPYNQFFLLLTYYVLKATVYLHDQVIVNGKLTV